jgi:hypothetical protein
LQQGAQDFDKTDFFFVLVIGCFFATHLSLDFIGFDGLIWAFDPVACSPLSMPPAFPPKFGCDQ